MTVDAETDDTRTITVIVADRGPGIAGAGQVRFRLASFDYRPGDIVVIYSDGIRSPFSAQDLIHILHPDPVRIARRILAEYALPDDDALVLVGCDREEIA